MSKDRESKVSRDDESIDPSIPTDPATIAKIEARNALLQVDEMLKLIDEGVAVAGFRLRPEMIRRLNRLAVDGTLKNPGVYRTVPVTITGSAHSPPAPSEVADHVDAMCDHVNDHWASSAAIHLASYLMWRLNWIHPFENGNGRTSRAISYAVLCIKMGYRLPGTPTIPDQIASDKHPYYAALDAADAAWERGVLDPGEMERLLTDLLCVQLTSVVEDASGNSLT